MILQIVQWVAEQEWMMKKLAFAIALTVLALPFRRECSAGSRRRYRAGGMRG